ncbi:MAG TPA: methyltransferase domain-containing protein [Geminicoccaceae bacterium]|nr:methyltransferase domain-containing protein [Geminicoccaceae bacterium]
MDADAFKAFEAERWGAKAESYDRLTGQVTRRLVEPLLDAAGVRAGTRVLDVATGPGHLAAAAAARGAKVTGVDIAAGMLAVAAARHPQVEFVQADAEALPFPPAEFDAVVGAFVMNHLPRPEVAVAGFASVLTRGGRAAFTVWDGPPRSRLITLLGEAVRATGVDPAGAIPAGPDSFRFAADAEFAALLRGGGLTDVGVETIDLIHAGDNPDALWEGMLGGSVRGAGLVEAQDGPTRERIRLEFGRLVEELRDGGRYRIPIAVKLASGRKA